MSKQNPDQVAGRNLKQSRGDRKPDSLSGRRMASDGEDQQTGAVQRAASGYLEQNPRREQHQEGGGTDKNEVGDDLEGDWEDEGGDPEDTGSVPPQTGDHVVPDSGGAESIKGLGRAQGRRVRSGKELIGR